MTIRLTRFEVLLAAALTALAGCQAAPEPVGFAPVIEQPDPFEALQAARIVPAQPEQPGGPMICVEARFISTSPDLIARIDGLRDGASKMLSEDDLWRLGFTPTFTARGLTSPVAEVISSPPLMVQSGQTARVTIGAEQAYVADLTCRRDEEAGTTSLEPTTRKLQTGMSLNVRPVAEGGEVVFAELEPVTLRLLGMRECSAEVRLDGESRTVNWREPVFLAGLPGAKKTDGLRVRPGQTVAVALRYTVHQATANARAYALDGKVTERYQPAGTGTGRSPLKRQALILIRAEIVSEGK